MARKSKDGIDYHDIRYLTPVQMAYYKYIKDYISKNNISPSREEIGRHFGVTGSSASRMVDKLHHAGAVYSPAGVKRAIQVRKLFSTKIRPIVPVFKGLASKRSLKASGVKEEYKGYWDNQPPAEYKKPST